MRIKKNFTKILAYILIAPIILFGLLIFGFSIYDNPWSLCLIAILLMGVYGMALLFPSTKKTAKNQDNEMEVRTVEQFNILQKEANHYAMWHKLSIFIAIAILIVLIYFTYLHIFGESACVEFNIQKFIPLTIPVSILIGVLINRANHYNQVSISYRHRARILDLVSIVPEKYDTVHEQVWAEMVSPLNVQTKDKTKQALKLLQEINKALPKQD